MAAPPSTPPEDAREDAPAARALARLVAPSGPIKRVTFDEGLAAMQALGIPLAWDGDEHAPGDAAGVLATGDYLAGSDARRADELLAALAEQPAALWMVRGGYGAVRTLETLGERLAASPPAPLWGFSDGTALLAAWDRLGWPAWHGPPLSQFSRLDTTSLARVRAAWHAGHVAPLEGLRPLAPGRATGALAGGNLCVVSSLVGTPFAADLRGRIVVLEDTGEPVYKIDRLFTQLRLSGGLEEAAGLVLGGFTAVSDDQRVLIDAFFADLAPRLGIPVAAGAPVTHDSANAPLPFGRGSHLRGVLEVPADGGPARLSFEPAGAPA